MPRCIFWIFLSMMVVLALPNTARAADRHGGYYYPPIMENASREVRIGFIVVQTNGQSKRASSPRYARSATGDAAENGHLVGLDPHSFATLFRARGVLAQLMAEARASALFRNLAVEDLCTFFDLARMLGFAQITISDGRTYAHRVNLR